ncbi:MAG TPA: alpha-2-macroglobulin, partial [Thermoanaerobaculia bacterium]|nr:alpha-2-macroglobulin [Thermoanaerobaculia bacterium]
MLRQTGLFLLLAFTLLSAAPARPPQATGSAYDALKHEAEVQYAEKSFSRARELYEQASKLTLPPAERRWVEFRLADTTWRADAGSPAADPAVRENARKALEELIRRDETLRDRVWAEANESLGDYFLTHPYVHDAGQAQRFYINALDFWAGSDDLALARRRYLAIVWRMADERTGYPVPREILVNAMSIADTPRDRTRARYLLAQQLLREGRPESVERALEHFEAIIAEGRASEWYDDALFQLAQHLSMGRNVVVNGRIERRADLPRALELYRRLISEFAKGESRYRDDAERAIRGITEASVGVSVHGTFLPDSEQEIVLTWRNVKQVELALTAVDLTGDIQPRLDRNWMDDIRIEGKPVLRRWTFETNDQGVHEPGTDRIRLNPRLERGAYVLTARAGGKNARQLVLVTDAHIFIHASPKRVQVFVSDVLTGEPIANARVWASQFHDRKSIVRTAQTDANGLAEFATEAGYGLTLVTAAGGARQAYHQTHTYFGHRGNVDAWRIYAFTDRPAYRPEETVQWKIIARARRNEEWTTPAGQQIAYEINSPRGEKV